MKFRGVLVLPLDKQRDRDDMHIDPAGVQFDPEANVPIFREFDYSSTPVGRGRLSRAEDGSILVEGTLDAPAPDKLAIGVVAKDYTRHKSSESHPLAGMMIHGSDLMSVALVEAHKDPNQPPISVLDD